MADFQKLRVWHLANDIVTETYRLLRGIRGESALVDQAKRSAISILSNIAEGSGRRTDADKNQFFGYARASAAELNAQYHILGATNLLPAATAAAMIDRIDHCGRMLSKLIAYLGSPGA